jgi:hypothetical protein
VWGGLLDAGAIVRVGDNGGAGKTMKSLSLEEESLVLKMFWEEFDRDPKTHGKEMLCCAAKTSYNVNQFEKDGIGFPLDGLEIVACTDDNVFGLRIITWPQITRTRYCFKVKMLTANGTAHYVNLGDAGGFLVCNEDKFNGFATEKDQEMARLLKEGGYDGRHGMFQLYEQTKAFLLVGKIRDGMTHVDVLRAKQKKRNGWKRITSLFERRETPQVTNKGVDV